MCSLYCREIHNAKSEDMAISKVTRAEQILGTLFSFKEKWEGDNENVNKAIYYFRDYVQSIRPPVGKSKEWMELLETLGLKGKDV
jgi:hypothetical protein